MIASTELSGRVGKMSRLLPKNNFAEPISIVGFIIFLPDICNMEQCHRSCGCGSRKLEHTGELL